MKSVLLFMMGVVISLLSGSLAVNAAPEEHPGKRLVEENRCAVCHQIGVPPAQGHLSRSGPSFERIGRMARPDWLLDYLLKPKWLRPGRKTPMPDFRFSRWEATALTAYFEDLRFPWPESELRGKNKPAMVKGNSLEYQTILKALGSGDVRRGRLLFVSLACSGCHGDPDNGNKPAKGRAQNTAPDLREMSRKLTREGLASVLFAPQQIHPGSHMPSLFFEHGKPRREEAALRIADLTAYIASLSESAATPGDVEFRKARKQFPRATAQRGERIAWQFNCAGCHLDTGFDSRLPEQVAAPLGYRNAPSYYTRDMVRTWVMNPPNVVMNERLHGMGRMPTYEFTPEEARLITDWLFSIDGPKGSRTSAMIMFEYGREKEPGRFR